MKPHVLLRSSWQTVNIGDIAHTPGMVALLRRYVPEARVTLWPFDVGNGVREMLLNAFPDLHIAEGKWDENSGAPESPALRAAWDDADFLLHGSGPSVVAHRDLKAWAETGRPYGVYGVTLDPNSPISFLNDELAALLSGARFVFTRETISLEHLKAAGATCPVMEFAPDATFATHLSDEATARSYLARNGLRPGEFIAAIPRLRYTPYYQIRGRAPSQTELQRQAVSDEFAARDHDKLARALEIFVRATGQKVLACPEMTYEVPLAKTYLIDPQPADIRDRFVWRDSYWRPDEACSVYAQAAALVSMEMHSPIMAIAHGTPALHLRTPTDTCKGQMWRDVRLGDWLFEIDDTTAEEIAATLLDIHARPEAARQTVEAAQRFVAQRQQASCAVLRTSLVPA